MMKQTFFILFLLSIQVSHAQDCKTIAANKPSVLVRGQDQFQSPNGTINSKEVAKIKPHITKAENWTKKILAGFTGAKLLNYNSFYPDYLNDGTTHKDFNAATGLKSYFDTRMMFFAYYCYDKSNTIQTEGESGSTISISFNNFFAFRFTQDVGAYSVNGKPAFRIITKKRSEGRIDFYENWAEENATSKMYIANDFIILRNSDKPVFIPVTRKEYLQQMLIDMEIFAVKDAKFSSDLYTQNIKQFEAEMKVYKEMDKTYTPEKEAKRRKWFEEDQEKLKKTFSKGIPGTEATKALISQYLTKPDAWLNKSFKNFYPYSNYSLVNVGYYLKDWDKSYTNEEQETLEEIVTVNPAYYNRNLGSDVPQLIMVHLRNGTYTHMAKVTALVKQPGALAPLEAMLTGKSTATQITPSIITSTYKLGYLPKLNKLTPLVVPANMPASTIPVIPVNNPPTVKLNIETPTLSTKLKQLPTPIFTKEAYTNYITDLNVKISTEVKPETKQKADDYIKNKKLTQSKDISNAAFAAWLQNTPRASLYLYSKAVVSNPSDALAANNFSAFLILGGLSEKAIPILEYWNIQKPSEAIILSNLGNAYYRLGDMEKAMNYLTQAVKVDSLQPTANKILCMIYLKKGDTKNAKDHGTKSLTGNYDEQVISLLQQLDNKTKPGEIMSRWPSKEFPMLKRIQLPMMPSKLDDMEQFEIDLAVEKNSLEITIADIENKMPQVNEEIKQQVLMASFRNGLSPLRAKAQYIIMDAMQTYQLEMVREDDVFKYNLKLIAAPFSAKLKAIIKKYADQLNKLEGGVAGDEDKITALELAKCKEINAEKEKYLSELSKFMNASAQRKEFISRKFYADYANWAPYWMPETTISFPTIQRDYLKDILTILNQYSIISKENCTAFEPLPKKQEKIKEWEDEYCANFKFKYGFGPVKVFATCTSWGIEGGEGVVGDLELKYNDDGSFADFTVSAGFGETWKIGEEKFVGIEASASIKEFIKFGKNKASKEWEIKDFGLKSEVTLEGRVGKKVSAEIKVLEVSASVNAGIEFGGVDNPLLFLK